MNITPYLFFEGRCEEAVEFYRKALGAEVQQLMRFKDGPDPSACKPASLDKIMHGALKIGDTVMLVSDGRCEEKAQFKGFSLSLSPDTAAEAEKIFAALRDGGQVIMPMGKTFWSPAFGMVTDRFGVMWMVNVMR